MDDFNYILETRYTDCTNEEPALHQAVIRNDLKVLKWFIEFGFDINIEDKHGKLPIAYAFEDSQLEILDLLLAAGLNIYQSDNFGEMQFSTAFKSGHENVIKKYLEHKINLNMVDEDKQTAIHYLMDNRCYEISNILKQLNFDVDVEDMYGRTPMYLALRKRNFHWMKLLLARGANANYVSNLLGTPLNALIASRCNHSSSQHSKEECSTWALRCMELLIENGAKVNRKYYYFSILKVALTYHDFEVVTPLLKKFAIIETSGTSLVEINQKMIQLIPKAKSYYSDVKTELKRMMELEHHKKVSYFDILIQEDDNTLAEYFRSSKSREDFRNNLNNFSHYSKNLRRKFTKGIKREEEISKKRKC